MTKYFEKSKLKKLLINLENEKLVLDCQMKLDIEEREGGVTKHEWLTDKKKRQIFEWY